MPRTHNFFKNYIPIAQLSDICRARTVQSKGLAMLGYLEPEIFTLHIVKVLLILSWIATSTNEVGFHAGPAFPSLATEALPGTQCSWVRLEQCEWIFLLNET